MLQFWDGIAALPAISLVMHLWYLMITYASAVVEGIVNWNTLATCKRVLFCLTFPSRFHPIAQFWYENAETMRNEAEMKIMRRTSQKVDTCDLIRFTVVTCCYHPGRRRESRSERLGRCGNVQLGLRVQSEAELVSESSSWFLSAWRFMVRQP